VALKRQIREEKRRLEAEMKLKQKIEKLKVTRKPSWMRKHFAKLE